MPAFLAPTPRARFFESYSGPDQWETDAHGQIKCAPSTKLNNQLTTMTNNGQWCVGPGDDPKMHVKISEGGFALKKEQAAPDGWEKRLSHTTGREFLHNPKTGQTQWPKKGASFEKQNATMEFREDCRARALERTTKAKLNESQDSSATNPFGSGPIEYDDRAMGAASQQLAEIRRPEEGERPTRQQLVKFAKQMAPGLRSGCSSALADAAVVDAMRKIHRRVSGGEAKPASMQTARTDISADEPATERMQRVGGAMVNVLSTARIDKRLSKNQRRTDRFERHMKELQKHEKETSDRLKNAQIISGMCGSDTEFIRMPGDRPYNPAEARAGGFGRTEHEEQARHMAAYKRELEELEAQYPRTSLAAEALGAPSARWQGTRGRQTKTWATVHDKKMAEQRERYSSSQGPQMNMRDRASMRLSSF